MKNITIQEKEYATKSYSDRCKEIMAMNAPWIPDTGKVIVNNTDRYSAMKNDIQDKMRAIHAPLLSEREKEDVFMSLEDDLDMMIRRAGMR